jgi:hypothetical protein
MSPQGPPASRGPVPACLAFVAPAVLRSGPAYELPFPLIRSGVRPSSESPPGWIYEAGGRISWVYANSPTDTLACGYWVGDQWVMDQHGATALVPVHIVLAGGFEESHWFHFGPFFLFRDAPELHVVVHPRADGLPRFCSDFGFGYAFTWAVDESWRDRVRESVEDAFLTGT